MIAMKMFKDPSFLLCHSTLSELRNMFDLEYQQAPDSISPMSSSNTSDGINDNLSRKFDKANPPEALPATVCMRDLYYRCPSLSEDSDWDADSPMDRVVDTTFYPHKMNEDPYVPISVMVIYCYLTNASNLDLGVQACEEGIAPMKPSFEGEIIIALMNAPDQSLTVGQIYEWFEQNSSRPAKDEKRKWRNRIRHELCTKKVRLRPAYVITNLTPRSVPSRE